MGSFSIFVKREALLELVRWFAVVCLQFLPTVRLARELQPFCDRSSSTRDESDLVLLRSFGILDRIHFHTERNDRIRSRGHCWLNTYQLLFVDRSSGIRMVFSITRTKTITRCDERNERTHSACCFFSSSLYFANSSLYCFTCSSVAPCCWAEICRSEYELVMNSKTSWSIGQTTRWPRWHRETRSSVIQLVRCVYRTQRHCHLEKYHYWCKSASKKKNPMLIHSS